MTVSELILLLSTLPKDAVVIIGDANDGGVGRIREEDVREVRLRFDEANGLGWYELVEGSEPFDVKGVRLG